MAGWFWCSTAASAKPEDAGSSAAPPPVSDDGSESKCPVSPEARAVWLRQQNENKAPPAISSLNQMPVEAQQQMLPQQRQRLSVEREVSSIPKYRGSAGTAAASQHEAAGAEAGEAHWVYPSQQMFFDAMRRKNWNPRERDMSTVVPIHNAVNERAWQEILRWERGQGGEQCGGPQLVRFEGDASKVTPKARLLSLAGYNLPFDRHDWTIDRCGRRVDYVIDFYTAAPGPSGEPGFYLDVRPKLNSVEGARMRAFRFLGM